MLISENAIVAVSETLQATDFYRPSNGLIYRNILDLHNDGTPVDVITLTDHLKETGGLERAGGRDRLIELANLVPASANASHYATIVRELATLRDLIKGGDEIATLGWERPGDNEELLERAETIAYSLRRTDHAERPLADDVADTLTHLQHLAENPRELLGVPSGFPDVDKITHGFRPGNLIIVAGRPGMGKSALAGCVAAHVSGKQQIPTVVFTLEMSKTELLHRFIALGANVENESLKLPWKLSKDEWVRVIDSANRLAVAPLTIYDDGVIRPATVRSRLRRLKARVDVGLVIVDYLQLMQADKQSDSRYTDVTAISQALKQTARELEVPVLALAQLSRAVEQRPDKRPVLSDLRDSGAIEQDADIVAFLYRDSYYHPDSQAGNTVEFNIAKHRDGETDLVRLSWSPAKVKFSSAHLRVVEEAA